MRAYDIIFLHIVSYLFHFEHMLCYECFSLHLRLLLLLSYFERVTMRLLYASSL